MDVLNSVQTQFSDRVEVVITLTLDLQQALGEKITSGDLELMWVSGDATFQAKSMDDIGGQDELRKGPGNSHAIDRVLCTTELGLVRVVMNEMEREGKGSGLNCLLKTKIALESVTEGMPRWELT